MSIRLVVGLGNPGARYEGTRHNVGFEAVDLIEDRIEISGRARFGSSILLKSAASSIWLFKPMEYMNLSGSPVARLVRYHKIELDRIVAIHDDIDLRLGDVRAKRSGGHGGHNGLRSIIDHLGSSDFDRIRIGVGRPPSGADVSGYVTARFDPTERAIARESIERAAEMVLSD